MKNLVLLSYIFVLFMAACSNDDFRVIEGPSQSAEARYQYQGSIKGEGTFSNKDSITTCSKGDDGSYIFQAIEYGELKESEIELNRAIVIRDFTKSYKNLSTTSIDNSKVVPTSKALLAKFAVSMIFQGRTFHLSDDDSCELNYNIDGKIMRVTVSCEQLEEIDGSGNTTLEVEFDCDKLLFPDVK